MFDTMAQVGKTVCDGQPLVDKAYREIRSMVINGILPPGGKAVVRLLSDKLGVSATPVKQALAALERDGFLVAVFNRGYFVPMVSLKDMRDIYELRELIDGLAGRNVAHLPDCATFADRSLRPLYKEQSALSTAGDLAGYRDLDFRFHREIWRASGNMKLLQIGDNLAGQIRLAWNAYPPAEVRRASREHLTIIDAIGQGDAKAAERASRQHARSAIAGYARLIYEMRDRAGEFATERGLLDEGDSTTRK